MSLGRRDLRPHSQRILGIVVGDTRPHGFGAIRASSTERGRGIAGEIESPETLRAGLFDRPVILSDVRTPAQKRTAYWGALLSVASVRMPSQGLEP